MEGEANWMQQQQSVIAYDALTSMVAELMTVFELAAAGWATPENGDSDTPEDIDEDFPGHDWVSPSKLTRVIRHGSSASLYNLLNQIPNAIAEEFDVIHCGVKVVSWKEYRWPQLQSCDSLRYPSGQVSIPILCLNELMQFHETNATSWLRRFRLSGYNHVAAANRIPNQVSGPGNAPQSARVVQADSTPITLHQSPETRTSRLMKLA